MSHRSGRREEEPLRSDGVGQWRGAGGAGRSEGGFASRFNAQRQNETRQPMERPAHMRLNLQRKNESGSASRPAMMNPRYVGLVLKVISESIDHLLNIFKM